MIENTKTVPGYREPWFWFLMAPLLLVFVMGFTMLYLSISTSDGVIVDNFYKDGLAINAREEQDLYARELGLSAQLRIDQTLVNLTLNGNIDEYPDTVWLHIIHPTKESFDTKILLQLSGNIYSGALPAPVSGRYQAMISPDMNADSQEMWRLHSKAIFPIENSLEFLPK